MHLSSTVSDYLPSLLACFVFPFFLFYPSYRSFWSKLIFFFFYLSSHPIPSHPISSHPVSSHFILPIMTYLYLFLNLVFTFFHYICHYLSLSLTLTIKYHSHSLSLHLPIHILQSINPCIRPAFLINRNSQVQVWKGFSIDPIRSYCMCPCGLCLSNMTVLDFKTSDETRCHRGLSSKLCHPLLEMTFNGQSWPVVYQKKRNCDVCHSWLFAQFC